MASTINSTTSSGVVITSDNTGQLALQAAGTTIMTVTSTGVTTQVGAPAFAAYLNVTTALGGVGYQKVTFDSEEYDTNNNFASSRFTPTVAGYYQLNTAVNITTSSTSECSIAFFKNGSIYKQGIDITAAPVYGLSLSSLVYLNGTTDYVEVYFYSAASGKSAYLGSQYTWFNGFLARSA